MFSLLIGLVAAMSLAGFVTLGLATSSFVGLAACCLAIGVVFGERAGFWVLGGFVVAVGAIGAAVCRGLLTGLQVTDPFLLEPQTWVSQLAGFAGFTAVILVVSGALQSRLSNTLLAVSRQAEELRESEGRYRLLADNMRDVLFLQDLDFGIEYVESIGGTALRLHRGRVPRDQRPGPVRDREPRTGGSSRFSTLSLWPKEETSRSHRWSSSTSARTGRRSGAR